ncbi:MAG: UDP-N-acetylglucosamine--N-acetylmuramyl-(pentapeptide) pyrophosphoryl-undecaprenol N-acetylglucosamine transferase [Patescibacteria group bacterium]
MKILFAGGGGTGGHFYPIIAVARALRDIAEREHIIAIDMFFAADNMFDENILSEEGIHFINIPSGKIPRYASLHFIVTPFKILLGIMIAFWKLYILLPDVIFSKGGYSAFPILVGARILRIPVIIHESDSIPGKVNTWSGKWARRVAISFSESSVFFKNINIALIGNPIRHQVVGGNLSEALDEFELEENIPVILILGGSQGAEIINESILDILTDALSRYQIIHQTGKNNIDDALGRSGIVLEKSEFKHRYHPYAFLGESDLRNAARAASIVVSRAGSGSIFELAAWRLPAILIPLESSAQDHQRENAYAYAHFGGCDVIEETNLKPHILLSTIDKILNDPQKIQKMKLAAQEFAKLDAAEKIAEEIIKLGIHE